MFWDNVARSHSAENKGKIRKACTIYIYTHTLLYKAVKRASTVVLVRYAPAPAMRVPATLSVDGRTQFHGCLRVRPAILSSPRSPSIEGRHSWDCLHGIPHHPRPRTPPQSTRQFTSLPRSPSMEGRNSMDASASAPPSPSSPRPPLIEGRHSRDCLHNIPHHPRPRPPSHPVVLALLRVGPRRPFPNPCFHRIFGSGIRLSCLSSPWTHRGSQGAWWVGGDGEDWRRR
jgi:hypothetical protein